MKTLDILVYKYIICVLNFKTYNIMSNQNSGASAGGIGFVGVLTIVFIVLKLLEKIDWSWWWVLSPLWIEAALILVIGIVTAIAVMVRTYRKRKKAKKA